MRCDNSAAVLLQPNQLKSQLLADENSSSFKMQYQHLAILEPQSTDYFCHHFGTSQSSLPSLEPSKPFLSVLLEDDLEPPEPALASLEVSQTLSGKEKAPPFQGLPNHFCATLKRPKQFFPAQSHIRVQFSQAIVVR